jgi:hypothetical protein
MTPFVFEASETDMMYSRRMNNSPSSSYRDLVYSGFLISLISAVVSPLHDKLLSTIPPYSYPTTKESVYIMLEDTSVITEGTYLING